MLPEDTKATKKDDLKNLRVLRGFVMKSVVCASAFIAIAISHAQVSAPTPLKIADAVKLGVAQKHAESDVRVAYWELVYAAQGVPVAGSVVSRADQLVKAKPASDKLKRLITSGPSDPLWSSIIDPIDRPATANAGGAGTNQPGQNSAVQAAQRARELAEQHLGAVQAKFDFDEATNYEVIQAQRDLSDAREKELQATLDYRKALNELERVTKSPPDGR